MTPRDWNEMKKLLADVAKGNDVQEVLKKVESVGQKKCTASANVAITLINSAVSKVVGNSSTVYVGDSIAKVYFKGITGTVRVTASLKNGNSSTTSLRVANYDGDNIGSASVSGTTYKTVTFDIRVTDGDFVFFVITSSNTSNGNPAYCKLLTLGFDVEEIAEDTYVISV